MISLKIAIQAGGTVTYGKGPLRALLRKAGGEVAARARALIRAKGPDGKKRTSAPGDPPVSRTGKLLSNIRVRVSRSGETVSIVDKAQDNDAYYALFLEAGAKGGGGASRVASNILLAGEIGRRGRVLRRHNRMKSSAVSQARVLLPHPFLTRALDEVAEAGLGQRVADAVVSGIEFRRAAKPWSLDK